VCACSPESQLYPGLHPQQRGQQGEEGNSAPLLRSGETPPGVLRPALEPSAKDRHGPVGAGPEEGHRNDEREAERVGAVQPGKEKAVGRPYCSLPVPEGGL